MAQVFGPKWNGYVGAVSVRSGTGAIVARAKAASLQIDSADAYQLKFNSNGTVRTVADTASAQTLTNKTFTAPALASPVLSGAVTGVYTLGGTPTLTSPVINTPVINSPVVSSLHSAFSTATVAAGYAVDTYLAGSSIAMPPGGFVAGARYTCLFDMVKTGAGTAAFTITVRIGAAASVADAAILTLAFAVGTAAIDTGTFEVFCHFRTVGAVTAAVLAGTAFCSHALAATGLITTGASGNGQVTAVSAGFDSTVAATFIGVSVNGGAAFSGTNTIVEAELRSY